jgi:hypothetical protein
MLKILNIKDIQFSFRLNDKYVKETINTCTAKSIL